jgi:hypothetical protein
VPLERSVAEWLGVKVGHVVFASDLLDFDEAHINLFTDVVDDHEEVLTFLEISLVVCSDRDDHRVVMAGSWMGRCRSVEIEKRKRRSFTRVKIALISAWVLEVETNACLALRL